MSTLQIELDERLLALVEARAARLGKPASDVVADVLRRGLEGGQLRAILDAGLADGLGEDEAMQLAVAELAAARAERAASARP